MKKYGHEYSGLETSNEILQALEERYDGLVCDPKSEAYAEWADPSDMLGIVARAWEIADWETKKIFWGCESFNR